MAALDFEPLVSEYSGLCIDDMTTIAAARCIEVYEDFDKSEIGAQAASVREAWKIGQAISERGDRLSRYEKAKAGAQ